MWNDRRLRRVAALLTLCVVGLALGTAGCGGGGGAPSVVLSAVSPSTGFSPGGATVVLSGTGFTANGAGANTVTVGGAPAADVTALSDGALTCKVPAGVVGLADVQVTNANGTATLAGGFHYYTFPPNFPAGDLLVSTDAPGAAFSQEPALCCQGENAYLVWQDTRNGSTDIYFNRSTDGGATWQAADTRLDTDAAGAESSNLAQVCCDGPNVYVVWVDDRAPSLDIYFNRSTDGGATWLASDVQIDRDPTNNSDAESPTLCCDGHNVYVAYYDDRNGAGDIYLNRSTDGGATWQAADTRLDTDAAGAALSHRAQICCSGPYVHVAWVDTRNGLADVYANSSVDGGATWRASDVRLDTDLPGATTSDRVRVCCDGARVYATWSDERIGFADVYFNRSTDGGATWQAADTRLDTTLDGTARSENPAICCAGDGVYVAWQDLRAPNFDAYLNRSLDGGATWQAADVRMDTDVPGAASSVNVAICCDGSNVFVGWEDDRDGLADVYVRASRDGGATWQASETRLDADPAGSANSVRLRLCCEGAKLWAAWQDQRDGNPDIYVKTSVP